MSYKLQKPYSEKDYADFIVRYSHNLGLKIVNTEDAVYALEENEIMIDGVPAKDPNYESNFYSQQQEQFEREFFETSLGWIRRKVTMQDGSAKDFLGDLLFVIKSGIELGQQVKIITYKTPDFSQTLTSEYLISLQEEKTADTDFVRECLMQTMRDFGI